MHCMRYKVEGVGSRNMSRIMDGPMEKNMEHDIETRII